MRKNVLIMFCSCLCSDVFAQAGTLDSSFDFDGKVITSSNAGGARIWDLIVQSDGKIIAAGGSGPIGVSDVIVARYNNDGSIDSSYGLNGIFTNDFGGFDLILSVDMQADGKVIAVGEANNGLTRDVLVMRLNQNGTLDSTFGTNGSTIINVINVDEFAYDVELTSTEKITICFQVDYGSSGDWGLMRLNNDGSYDTSFNNTGYGIYTIGNPDHVDGIALQNDNKIVGAGNREVVRFTEDGILDTTFNSTGVIFASVGALPLALSEVLIQSDGKIIVGGSVDGNAWDFVIARYNVDGTVDSTFNNTGSIIVSAGYADQLHGMKLQNDGKIVASGYSSTAMGGPYNYFLIRVDTNGALDNTFGTGGKVLTDFIGSDDIAFALAIQPDLKIVAAGETWQNGKWNFSLARYFSGLNVGVIDEPAEHFELSAYPNPASSYINLNYELANNATVSIAVYDVMGKRIKSYVHNETKIKGMQAEALAVDDLKKGVYILRIETERVQRGVRFVKN